LAGVFFFLSRILLLLGVAGVGLLVLILLVPARERLVSDLELSSSEQSRLDDQDKIVAEFSHRDS
jgi:hypothetical protein